MPADPNFITLNGTTFTISPNSAALLWHNTIVNGNITDTIDATSFSFEVQVISDPPYFLSELVNLTAYIGNTLNYKLPKIKDN